MLGNLTLGGLTYVKVTDTDSSGASVFRETSRGVTKPTEILIRNTEVTESRSKKPAFQTSMTFNRYDELEDGSIAAVISTTLTNRVIKDPGVIDAAVLLQMEHMIQLLTGTSADPNAQNKRSAIYVTREQ